MKPARPRIFLVSNVVPATDRGGGCMALYRHFCEHDDFDVAIASRSVSTDLARALLQLPAPWAERVRPRRVLRRMRANIGYLTAGTTVPAEMLRFARDWRPDIVFSIADDWHAALGFRLARLLRVPFAVNFQDLFACSTFQPVEFRPYCFIKPLLLRRYRAWQRDADAVFHTCPGMRQWFGREARGEVLFPLGAPRRSVGPLTSAPPRGVVRLVYAGNCYGPYGRLILRLAEAVLGHPRVRLDIYAAGNDWDTATVARFSEAGVYHGYLPYSLLERELLAADAFLTVMSFDAQDATFVQTSFTTKWLDYASFGKPVIVWAPRYASTTAFAREQKAATVVDLDDTTAVLAALVSVANDPAAWRALATASSMLAGTQFDPESIHSVLVRRLTALVG